MNRIRVQVRDSFVFKIPYAGLVIKQRSDLTRCQLISDAIFIRIVNPSLYQNRCLLLEGAALDACLMCLTEHSRAHCEQTDGSMLTLAESFGSKLFFHRFTQVCDQILSWSLLKAGVWKLFRDQRVFSSCEKGMSFYLIQSRSHEGVSLQNHRDQIFKF